MPLESPFMRKKRHTLLNVSGFWARRATQPRRWAIALGAATVLCCPPSLEAAPETTILAAQGQARMTIRVPAASDAVVKRAAHDLAEMLGRIAKTEFTVETGDVASGIVVALASDLGETCPEEARFDRTDPFQRDGYLLVSQTKRLWLIGATPQAVEHAVWDLLHRLGYRCYFPGPAWEVLPPAPETLAIAVHAREIPAFAQRRVFNASGSFNPPEWLERWQVRNRMRSAFDSEVDRLFWGFFLKNNQRLAENPTRLGFSGGDRAGTDVKHQYLQAGLCLGHAEQRRELVDYAVSDRRRNEASRSVSATSGTDWNWCRCAKCLAAGPPVDRAVALANDVADRLKTVGGVPWTVGLMVEGAPAVAPPSRTLHPQVAPRLSAPTLLTLSFHEGNFNAWQRWIESLASPWRQHRARTVSITCRFGGSAGVADLSWTAVTRGIPALREAGFDGFVADIGQSWGDYGLNLYVLARWLWRPGPAAAAETVAEEFLERCFGAAREPARRYFELAGGLSGEAPLPASRRFAPEAIAKRYALLADALHRTSDAATRSRIADLVLHTRLWELRGALFRAADGEERERLSAELMRLAYRARARGLAPAREMFTHPDWVAAGGGKNTGAGIPEEQNPWKTTAELTDEEILSRMEAAP